MVSRQHRRLFLVLLVVACLVQTLLSTWYLFQGDDGSFSGSVDVALNQWSRGAPALQKRRMQNTSPFFHDKHPNRIPGYRFNDTRTYFGYVMRDFVTRIFSRNDALSQRILVVSPLASSVACQLQQQQNGDNIDIRQKKRRMMEQEFGYEVGASILIRAHEQQSYDIVGLSPATTRSNNTTDDELTIMPDQWWLKQKENPAQQRHPSGVLLAVVDLAGRNDEIVKQSVQLLQESTVKYLLLGIGVDQHGSFGKEAALLLMEQFHYKVQILSNSHFPSPDSPWTPNALLNSKEKLDEYFAVMAEHATTSRTPVRGYLFCTQGLDLAIPSASVYIKSVSVDKIGYQKCAPNNATLQFDSKDGSKIHTYCNNIAAHYNNLWRSHPSIDQSEAVCARVQCDGKSSAACATRIVAPKNATTTAKTTAQEQGPRDENGLPANYSSRPNLLVLMIDPISRARFESLPKTHRLLQRLNFTSFSKYTAVGNTSETNQAALYSGRFIDSLDMTSAALQDGKRVQWLWDTLKEEGYATFKAQDGCIKNSNMFIQSQTHHGEALSRMMCFDFQRPNCVGGRSAAQHLVEHTVDFVRHYSGENRPWAAFAHFVDSDEDTMMLEGTLDAILWKALYSLYQKHRRVWDNTLIIVASGNGILHGSYSSSPQGLRERFHPILKIHSPIGQRLSDLQRRTFEVNKDLWTTPFDVYETILDALLERKKPAENGLTLLAPLPFERNHCSTTNLIPSFVCDVFLVRQQSGRGTMIPYPPSVLSFYADIPAEQNKKAFPPCLPASDPPFFTGGQTCVCATSHRTWYTCSSRPNKTDFETAFTIVECGNHSLYDIDVKADPAILSRSEIQDAKASGANLARPNILFIEVDSVSLSYADRHFPKTRELLNRYRARQTKAGIDCLDQFCSVEFPLFSVTGANSIPNQVSAFSGCIVTTGTERCGSVAQEQNGTVCADESNLAHGLYLANTYLDFQTWCRVSKNDDVTSTSPWLFDIARQAGYVTLFAEEFCYEDSPYVAQNNIYQLEADILPHRMFCRVAEGKVLKKGIDKSVPLWKVDGENHYEPCIAGNATFPKVRVALDHIEQMWDAYPEVSKFAYLNAMAAHDYRMYSRMTSPAEAYDNVLSSFLEGFLARNDAKDTIIIVRSDHGLQGGPTTVDYATQIEALRPWNEMIVPQDLPLLSLETLVENQGRLVTASDLYRTVAEVMTAQEPVLMPEPSTWTINIFNTSIPLDRTCQDAKVPLDYCVFEDQRTFSAPNVATCNLAERDSNFVCPSRARYFRDRMADEVDKALNVFTTIVESDVCPNDGSIGSTLPSHLAKHWRAINDIVESFPGSKVSGGIFLYPLQASLLSSIVEVLGTSLYAREKRNLTVCETGFGASHSAALFLASSQFSHVHTFDKFDRPYQLPLLKQLQSKFAGRLTHHKGDSCKTVPRVLTATGAASRNDNTVKCDFLHGSSLCRSDNCDLIENSPCGVILTSTAMHSLLDEAVYFGKNGQWAKLRERGCIRDIICFGEEERELDRDLWFQKKDSGPISHKFCLAITTGKCTKTAIQSDVDASSCDSEIARLSNLIGLLKLCKTSSKNELECDSTGTRCTAWRKLNVP